MNRIDYEIKLLLEMAEAAELPSYPQEDKDDSYYANSTDMSELAEYYSGENDAFEHQLKALWANDPEMQKCIPIILAAVEKSRDQKSNASPSTELYNYTM